jgi:hypothetical protein
MDETLETLFIELCSRIDECANKNPSVDMEDIKRSSLLIKTYIDGFKVFADTKETIEEVPEMSYEELCGLISVPRIIPKGHAGPTRAMVKETVNNDKERALRFERVVKKGKEMEATKDKPYF